MTKAARILIVEDIVADAEMAEREICKALKDCTFQLVETRKDFLKALESFQPDVILSDYALPRFDGMTALKLARKHAPFTPLIIWTGASSEDIAVDCMKAGASNYVLKENLKRLGLAVLRALEERELLLARKQAEESIQNNEKRFRALIQNGLDSICLLSEDGTLLWESPSSIRTLNYPPDEHLGRNIFVELMHPEDTDWCREVYAKILQEPGKREFGTFRLRHADGTWHWVEAIITNMLHEPSINAIVANYRDVNEQRQVEEALKEERNLLRTLIDNIPDRIYAMDIQGRKTLTNTADWQASGGKTMQDILGKTDFDNYPPDLANEFWQQDKTVIESGQAVINHEAPGLDAEGQPASILTTKIPLRNSDGKVIGLVGIGRDITERKQAEEHINDLLAFNEKILNHSAVGILTYKVSGSCVFANEKAASIVGTTVAELLAQNFRTVESWKHSGLYDLVEKAINASSPATADIHQASTFGKDVWMTAHCVTFKAKGEDHILLSISDITERKQAEEKLRYSENRYRQAIKATNDVIWESNLQTKQLFWSENAQIVFGYAPEEVNSSETWWEDHLHPDDRERILDKVNGLIEGDGTLWMDEYRFLLKDGSYKYISDRGYIERDMNGTPQRITGAMTDITERKRAEEALRESENRLVMALSGAQMSVWEWDLKTNQILWSPEFFKMTGVDEDQFEGTLESFTELIHGDDITRVRNAAEKAMREQSLFAEEFRIVCPDGEVRWLSNLGQAEYDSTGSHLRLIGTVQDVTQRKQAEIERQTLLEIMQGFANTDDLHELFKLIHHSVARVVYARNFFIVLYQPDTGLFEEIYSVDQYDPPAPPDKLKNSITSYVFRSGQPLLLTQALFDDLVQQNEVKLVGTNSASWLGVPLKTSGRTIGVMAVQDYEVDNRYSERDRDFLTSIATQVALAIERKKADIQLQQKNDDLGLLNAINEAVVQGQDLDSIVELLANELGRIFSVQGSTIYSTLYMLTPDKRSLKMQKYFFSNETARNIERLIGFRIPPIEIAIKEGGHFHQALASRRSTITTDPKRVQEWISEFTETSFLHPIARTAVRKLIPQIYKVLNINSVIAVPLFYGEETIGFWDVSSSGLFTVDDQKRIEHIGGQLTAVIQRQQADEKIRRSEEFLQSIQNALSANIAILNEAGIIIQVNSAWREFGEQNGLNQPNASIGLNYLEICDSATGPHANEASSVAQAIRSVMRGQNREARVEYPCHSPEVQRWFTLHITKFEDGDHMWVVLAHEEITERKRAEEALRESEEHYRAIFEGVQDAIFVESLDGRILMVNERACEMFGYSQEELLSKTVTDLVPEGNLILMADGENSLLSSEPHETLNRRANGEIFPIDISGRLQVINGETVLLVVVRDITERKKAEKLLQESEDRFSSAFEYASIGMALVSPEGRWLRVNWALCELVGYSEEEMVQKTFQDITYQDDLEKDVNYVKQVLTGEIDSYEMEKRYVHKSGRIIWVLLSVSLVRDHEGRPLYFISQIQDITERKLAEESLRAEREKVQNYLDIARVMMLALDREGNVALINQKGCEILGVSTNEIIGKNWLKTFLPESVREEVQEVFQELISDDIGVKSYYENPVLTSHGEERLIAWHNTVVRDSQGKIISTLSSGEDITERKQMEAAEHEQRTLAEALRDTAEILSSTLDYGEVLDHILAAVGRVVPHDAATIMLINGEHAQVVRSQGYEQNNLNTEIMGIRLPLSDTTNLHQMIETRQPVVVYDTDAYPGWKRLSFTDWLRSSVGAPISIYGEVIGFIFLDSRTPGFFTPVHAERLEAFANQAALAIHNAHLLQQAQGEIAERKRAEEELRFEKERLEKIAAAVPGLIGSLRLRPDGSGCMPFASPAIQDVYGFLPAELEEDIAPFFARVHPEDLPHLSASIQQSARSLLPWYGEFRYNHPTKGEVWIEGQSMPLREEDGSTIWHGFLYDITKRKQAEESLRESEARYHGLFQNLVDGFALHEIITDDEGKPVDYIFLEVNPAFEKMTGLDATHILGRRVTEVLPGVENERFIPIYGYVALTGETVHFEEYFAPLGRHFEINAYSPKHGQFAVTFVDVTERKQAEDEIRRRAEENSILLKTSLALTNLDLKATLQTIGDSAKNLFAADGCRVFLMEPDEKFLRCVLALQENLDAFSDLRVRLGEGVTGAVAASGQAEIVNEMQRDPRSVQVVGTPEEEEAIMFAPLKERDNTIGVLSIRRTGRDRPFQPADLELLEALASMAASAVSKARLFAETQRRLAELEALYENGLAVGRLLRPSEIGKRIINTFARYLPWHHVTIRLRQNDSDNLELVAFSLPNLKEEEQTNAEQHFITRINKVGQGLSGWVIQTGVPLRTGNVHAHPQYIDTHAGVQSGLYMPLKVGERVIGVISVESETPDAFTEQDERLLATLASQAAIAFENARLYQAIEQELSERKQAEEALRTSETHYRELADSITDVLFELDQELRYTHWNRASETLAGVAAKHAIGKSMYEIFGESEEQNRIRQIYEGVLKNHQPRTFETELILSGEKHSLEINAYPSTRGVSVVAKDVTDRKRSEIIMQKRFELMEYSAHHSLDELMQRTVDEVSEFTGSTIGFFHFVQEDQKTLGMQTWSTNTLKLFSVPISEGTHLPIDQAGVWADAVRQRRPLIQNDYEALSQKKGLPQGHAPITREIVIPIIRNERVMAVMGIGNKPHEYTSYDLEVAERLADYAWDVTERKQMQVALEMERNQLAKRVEERTSDLSQANSNLARALRVKDEFLANMSHELRTPLNAILGLSESLGEQIAGPLNEKQQKYITTISESGHHLLSLINDILDLAKIEAGQITLDINKVDIHQVCQASLRMIKQLAQKKNQDVVLEIGQEAGLMWADERRLKQMIVNLLGNAVKFTPENGKIGLEVRGDQLANKVTITVWDNGIGIKEDDLARLFQPFIQLDSGLAREATGTGLGLALVAQMARLHGGSVSVISEPGKGSRFSIILPWEPALAIDTASRLRTTGKFRAIKPDETNKPTLLLVEDTKEVIMMIRDYLELAGYKVVVARDGVEALAQARVAHPDLILMDVMMPRMDGFEATRRLRSEPEFKYTPIVALTALAMPSDRERCLAAGMDEYISKPVNLKALVRMIQSCLFNSKEPKPE